MIEWTKDFVQSEKQDMGKSTALVPGTRTQVTDEESQVSQMNRLLKKHMLLGWKKKKVKFH